MVCRSNFQYSALPTPHSALGSIPHSALRIPHWHQSSALNAREIKSRTAFFGSLPSYSSR
jgi:hypothetical protein